MLFLALYIVGIFAFCLGDAAIGYGVDFDGYGAPPVAVPAFGWPIAVPILIIMKFVRICHGLKVRRQTKESRKEKIRIALKREEDRAIQEAEYEVETELRRHMRR